jgi:hypothetical protein
VKLYNAKAATTNEDLSKSIALIFKRSTLAERSHLYTDWNKSLSVSSYRLRFYAQPSKTATPLKIQLGQFTYELTARFDLLS